MSPDGMKTNLNDGQEAKRDGTAGRTLKKIFRQDDKLFHVEEQLASRSMLMKPLRLSIFTELCEAPCGHLRSVARKVGRSVSSVDWNLGQLLDAGYIESSKWHGKKVYWPAGMIEPGDEETISMMQTPWAVQMLKVSRGADVLRERDMILAIGESQQTVEFRMGRMVSAGMLAIQHGNAGKLYSIEQGFVRNVRYYDSRANEFSQTVIALLAKDGLMPKNHRLRGSRLSVSISLPSGRRTVHIECSAMARARKVLGPYM